MSVVFDAKNDRFQLKAAVRCRRRAVELFAVGKLSAVRAGALRWVG